MSQINGADQQVVKSGAAGFFAALRNGFGLEALKGSLFSNVLAAAGNNAPQGAEASEQFAPDNTLQDQNDKTSTASSAKTNSFDADDVNYVRDMLNHVQNRIDERRNLQKRDLQERADEAARADKNEDRAQVQAGNETTGLKSASNSNKISSDEDCPIKPDQSAKSDENSAKDKIGETALKLVTVVDEPEKISPDKTGKTSDEKSAATDDDLSDLIATEQALLAVLQEYAQSKAAYKAAENSDTKTKPNLTVVAGTSQINANIIQGDSAGKPGLQELQLQGQKVDEKQNLLEMTQPDPEANLNSVMANVASHSLTENAKDVAAKQNLGAAPRAQLENPGNPLAQLAALAVQPADKVVSEPATLKQAGTMVDNVTAFKSASANAGAPTQTPIMAEIGKSTNPYDFASQLSAQRATRGGAVGLPPAIEQVAVQLHKMAKDGADTMVIQLRPQELGKIEIKLEFAKDGSNMVTGTITADQQKTLDMLQKDASGLQRALQDAGLRADSSNLQFNLRSDGQQNAFMQNMNGQERKGSNAGSFEQQNLSGAEMKIDVAEDVAYLVPGRVNLRV